MRNRFTLLICIFTSFAVLGSAPTHVSDAKLPTVFTQVAKSENIHDTLVYPVRIQSQINASVVADADAVVAKIVSPLGRSVKKNDRVMTLKQIDPVYDYRPLIVPAPVAGVVSSMDVTEGTRVAKGQKLATITDPKRISVLAEIASADLNAVIPGLQGELTTNGSSTKTNVKVQGISPQIDPATGTATCEISISEPNKGAPFLPSGQLGRVTFKVRQRIGYQIPEYALVYRDNRIFVRIVEDETAKFVPVEIGTSERGVVEITSGLKEGMPVVLRSSAFIAQGEKVKVQTAESGQFE